MIIILDANKKKRGKMNNLRKYILFIALCSMALFTSCDDDNNECPQFGTINITIMYQMQVIGHLMELFFVL